MGDTHHPATGCPPHRLREVEVHHVDLDLGYQPADWPAEYVAWELPDCSPPSLTGSIHEKTRRASLPGWRVAPPLLLA